MLVLVVVVGGVFIFSPELIISIAGRTSSADNDDDDKENSKVQIAVVVVQRVLGFVSDCSDRYWAL